MQRRNVVLRRSPEPGIVLGRVQRILTRALPLDALVTPIPSGETRFADPGRRSRHRRPPWRIVGVAKPTAGRSVCYSGRTSGVDQCGRIVSSRARGGEALLSAFAGVLVRCTTIRAREGDSGGPVYTAPGSNGAVRAVGLTTLIIGDRARCASPRSPRCCAGWAQARRRLPLIAAGAARAPHHGVGEPHPKTPGSRIETPAAR